jgi:hypothetical protein
MDERTVAVLCQSVRLSRKEYRRVRGLWPRVMERRLEGGWINRARSDKFFLPTNTCLPVFVDSWHSAPLYADYAVVKLVLPTPSTPKSSDEKGKLKEDVAEGNSKEKNSVK